MKQVISDILSKKELTTISENIVEQIIKEKLDKKIKQIISEKRYKTKQYKQFIKKIRAILRRQYGAFQNPKINRKKLFEKKDWEGLLKSHKSSKERFSYYNELYKKIFEITGKPKSILDIGCGMNPISYEYMNLKKIEYLACDISNSDLNIINKYFKIKKINGKIKLFDAIRDKYSFKKYDIIFAFKLFEILETTRSHKLTENIIKKLKAKYIVASFSTKTLSGRKMSRARRGWFEVMNKRLGNKLKIIELENEIFYIIE